MNVKANFDSTAATTTQSTSKVWSQHINHWFERHWLLTFNSIWGIFVALPFLAPALMVAGLTLPARILYGMYSFLCHQLPERS